MELVAEVEEKACRLARETAGVGEGKVGGDEEIVDVVVVNLSGDGFVVAGRASVAENGALVGGGPHETEASSVERSWWFPSNSGGKGGSRCWRAL